MPVRYIFSLFFLLFYIFCAFSQDLQVSRRTLGKVTHPTLNEISGIVPSVAYDSCYWVHNDSGDSTNIYLIDANANLLCTVELEGIVAFDVEEIAWLYIDGSYHLLVGDIGDNRALRDNIRFYLIQEPVWDRKISHVVVPQNDISVFTVQYPDKARDAEAFFVDPITRQLVLISKRDFHVHVYTSNMLMDAPCEVHVLKKETQLPLFFITAADISSDGQYILLKNLNTIFQWTRLPNETVVSAMNRLFVKIPYQPEPQGEAIAFNRDGKSFYTISERPLGLDSYLYHYQSIHE